MKKTNKTLITGFRMFNHTGYAYSLSKLITTNEEYKQFMEELEEKYNENK